MDAKKAPDDITRATRVLIEHIFEEAPPGDRILLTSGLPVTYEVRVEVKVEGYPLPFVGIVQGEVKLVGKGEVKLAGKEEGTVQ